MSDPSDVFDASKDGLAVLAFKVEALQFDLNRDLKFISMKDQLMRGRTLVLAAQRAGLFSALDQNHSDEHRANVIVVGAGVGGVSAALMACELGLSAKLVEATDAGFSVLGLGSDRLVSATVYDWPHMYSGSHAFPYVAPLRDIGTVEQFRKNAATLRFPATAQSCGELRTLFIKQLSKYQQKFGPNLDVMYGYHLETMGDVMVNPSSNRVSVNVQDSKGRRMQLLGQIVVFAMGFGLDKDNQQTNAAKEFFSYDGLKKDIEKATTNKKGGLVRIRGAGDGGLQEVLRFVLDDNWHDLYKCVSHLDARLNDAGFGTFWSDVRSRLQSAEDQATRALMWGYAEKCVYRELDAIYRREIVDLLKKAPDQLRAWRSDVVRKAGFKVQLVDDSEFSMKTYGLNRWLVGLLQEISAEENLVRLERVLPERADEQADVTLNRVGFGATTKQPQIGTADEKDLLRRIAFQGVPMTLDAVI